MSRSGYFAPGSRLRRPFRIPENIFGTKPVGGGLREALRGRETAASGARRLGRGGRFGGGAGGQGAVRKQSGYGGLRAFGGVGAAGQPLLGVEGRDAGAGGSARV